MVEQGSSVPFFHPQWLAGVRVLDLTRLLPGPFATQLIANLGAEVIKVEEPGTGDAMRSYPPYFTGTRSRERISALFACCNDGKKSITLNFRKPGDRARFLDLCNGVDAVVESFRPGVVSRLGIDYDAVKEVNPGIIYISLTGYGQFGPYRDLPGHDLNYVSLMGNLSLNGKQGAPPVVPGVQAADFGGGLFVLASLLGAIRHRDQTGEGCYVDVAMSDVAFNLARLFVTESIATGQEISREQNELLGKYPWYDVFECQDGRYIALCLVEEKFWATFCNAPGIDLTEYATNQMLQEPAKTALYEKMRSLFKTKPAVEWFALFKQWDIPGTIVQGISDGIQDPHVQARDLLRFGSQGSLTNLPAFPFPVKCAVSQRALLEYKKSPPIEGHGTTQVHFARLGEQNKEFFPKNGNSCDKEEL